MKSFFNTTAAAAIVSIALLHGLSGCDIKVNDPGHASIKIENIHAPPSKTIECVAGPNHRCHILIYSQKCTADPRKNPNSINCLYVEVEKITLNAGESKQLTGAEAASLKTCQGNEGGFPTLSQCLGVEVE